MNTAMDYRAPFSGFRDLMQYRVREILLVSTLYDAFVLEEDGRLSEKIFGEYLDLNLQFTPRINRVSSAEEAFAALEKKSYDLVITMPRISDMDPFDFGKRVKETDPGKKVVMLTYETITPEMTGKVREDGSIDRIFYWSGDSKILLAIIKYVEDMGNVEFDTRFGVQVIVVVEDSPSDYSRFLPIIYTEIMKQTNYLISHAVNNLHRLLRMRARPKILLAGTYEEALEIITRYRSNVLGVISDTGFPKDGELDTEAGMRLAEEIGDEIPELPFLLQSDEPDNARKAAEIGIRFLNKNLPDLFGELRNYILENYGFGEFVFRYPDGRVIARAADIADFEKIIFDLPEESLVYHARNNHFSRWFRARTEFEVADQLRQKDAASFATGAALRQYVLDFLARFFKRYQGGVILDFGASKMDADNLFIKLGNGSLGGKSRGVAFFNALLGKCDLPKNYPNLQIKTPRSFVICSDVFEEFIDGNGLEEFALSCDDEGEISRRFREAALPETIVNSLRRLITSADYPLAVRSSSILDDSRILPFAGIHKTKFLPNQNPDPEIRLNQLLDAVKLVYASVYFPVPKQYKKNAGVRVEDEKMGVLIQQVVGKRHGDIFYPVISGVAQSYNFYTYSYMKPEQGSVNLALGFGKIINEGGQTYRFSPAYPTMNPPYSTPEDLVQNSQDFFYALNLNNAAARYGTDDKRTFEKFELERAESDGTLAFVASAYSPGDDNITDSLTVDGPRIVTFAPVLKYNLIPLTDIINDLFEMMKFAYGSDVEIEFAVNIPIDKRKPVEFYLLQIRPMLTSQEEMEIRIDKDAKEDMICSCGHTIGNGIYQEIYDLIYVDPDRFDLTMTNRIAREIGELNQALAAESRKCILMGFGRLGTYDQWLGIPLKWHQMSQAQVVVEADCENLQVEPSLGSHFYHNLTSLRMGYFHINYKPTGDEFIDWDWLKSARVCRETEHVKLVRFERPIVVKIDGRNCSGVILKPY